jgi:hypothetical protein
VLKYLGPIPVLALLAGCSVAPRASVPKLAEEFVYTTLSFSPIAATATGLHQYQKQPLDEMLDDLSPAALDRQRRFYRGFGERLSRLRPETLSPQDRADFVILRDQVRLALLDLDEIQSAAHNPTLYVEALGNALFSPFILEYAPLSERFGHIVARLRKVPLFLDQARSNLVAAPAIWTKVAIDENAGNIALVDQTIRAGVPPGLKTAYAKAATPALAAMRQFQTYLETALTARSAADWRLGPDRYGRKFQYVLATGVAVDNTLRDAEKDLDRVRASMLELALPIHRRIAPAHGDHAGDAGRENAIVGEVLAYIGQRHSTPASYLDDARRDLEEARQFVAAKGLLTLPQHDNLRVIETPGFMRGVYGVGGAVPAPPLEPKLGAFYWVTPIPATWTADRKESKLREYNFYKLKLLTIHEAMPGHYMQAEFANAVAPKSRGLLRAVYGNGPYVEGWAQFATQTMLDEGFLDHSPEMQLTFLKEELRVLANAILDIRLHTLDMTDQEAMALMQERTFQEKEEAAAKLQRAKLSSCQLPTYYVGWHGWNRVRDEYRKSKGAAYRLQGFNDSALRQGAVPLTVLGGLLH